MTSIFLILIIGVGGKKSSSNSALGSFVFGSLCVLTDLATVRHDPIRFLSLADGGNKMSWIFCWENNR